MITIEKGTIKATNKRSFMFEMPYSEVIAAGGTLVATAFTFSRLFFKKINSIEQQFVIGFEKVNHKLNKIDKNLAVNTAFIDQILKQKER
jgi:hypothetical protein